MTTGERIRRITGFFEVIEAALKEDGIEADIRFDAKVTPSAGRADTEIRCISFQVQWLELGPSAPREKEVQ